MITLTCQGCGKEFLRNKKQHNSSIKRGRKFIACSRKCLTDARGVRIKKVSKDCLFCGINFTRKESVKHTNKFCSHSCAAKFNNRSRKITASPKMCGTCIAEIVYGKRKVCDNCKEINRYSKRSDWSKVTLSELRIKYSTSQYHAKIRGMSRSEYKRYNSQLSCVICNYSLHVDVAHIKAIKDFDMSSTLAEVNNINNLTALCPNHHWEFDHGHIRL